MCLKDKRQKILRALLSFNLNGRIYFADNLLLLDLEPELIRNRWDRKCSDRWQLSAVQTLQ